MIDQELIQQFSQEKITPKELEAFTGNHGGLLREESLTLILRCGQASILYKKHRIPKTNAKGQVVGHRDLYEPLPKLAEWQKKFVAELYKLGLRAHSSAFGFVSGRGIYHMAKRHVGKKYHLKMDLKDFFPTCTQYALKDQIQYLLTSRGLSVSHMRSLYLDDILPLFFVDKVLPQGAPSSPAISNWCFAAADAKLSKRVKPANPRMESYKVPRPAGNRSRYRERYTTRKRIFEIPPEANLVYSRYADDIVISGDTPLVFNMYSKFKRILATQGFAINKKKTRFVTPGKPLVFCGATVTEMISSKRSYRNRVRNLIHRYGRDVEHGRCEPGFYLEGGEPVAVPFDQINGQVAWISYLNSSQGFSLRQGLKRLTQLHTPNLVSAQ